MSARAVAAVIGGEVVGDGDVVITGPAAFDSRLIVPGGLFVAFAGNKVDGHAFADRARASGGVAVLGSRPTSLPTIVVPDTIAALHKLAAHVVAQLRTAGLTVIGITGSQGKTSTKNLLAEILSGAGATVATFGNLNNALGAPTTMLRAEPGTRFLVTEMGARHGGDIAALTAIARLDVAIVLNVGRAHIGEFGSQDAIARGKAELVQGLVTGGTAILNADDRRVFEMRALTEDPVLTFGEASTADVRVQNTTLDAMARPSFDLCHDGVVASVDLPLVGAHQALNAAAAAAAGIALGLPLRKVASALTRVSQTPGRLAMRELACGGTLLDDSYNSSPGSARSSLDALATVAGRRRLAVLGPIFELGDESHVEHLAVGEYAAARADVVAAVGADAGPIAVGAGSKGLFFADDIRAIEWLRTEVAAGDVVLVKASRGAHIENVAEALP